MASVGPGPAAGLPPDAGWAAPPFPSHRSGYDESFLGTGALRVPLPVVGPDIRAAVVDPTATGRARHVLEYQHFSIVMHAERRVALFTASNIDGGRMQRLKRAHDVWRYDPRLPEALQAGAALYADNELDRGHLVRRLDAAWGDQEEARTGADDTYFYTNCCPQHARFNQRLWLELEDYLLDHADTLGFRACVISGPVLDPADRAYRGVPLPRAYWKVAAMVHAGRGELSATAYLVSQADLVSGVEFVFGAVRTYQVPMPTVERLTGLDFGSLKLADPLREMAALRLPGSHLAGEPGLVLTGPDDLVL